MRILSALVVFGLLAHEAFAYTVTDTGDGNLYQFEAEQDVTIEGNTNRNGSQWLIVGTHPDSPKKRFLVQFEDIPANCSIRFAKMYLYFLFAAKDSAYTVHEVPYISRTLQVHEMRKKWTEDIATSTARRGEKVWREPYVGIDPVQDASPRVLDSVSICTGRKSGYIEFEVTEAGENWQELDRNAGFLIWATNEDELGRDIRFASMDHPDPNTHPKLHVLCDY